MSPLRTSSPLPWLQDSEEKGKLCSQGCSTPQLLTPLNPTHTQPLNSQTRFSLTATVLFQHTATLYFPLKCLSGTNKVVWNLKFNVKSLRPYYTTGFDTDEEWLMNDTGNGSKADILWWDNCAQFLQNRIPTLANCSKINVGAERQKEGEKCSVHHGSWAIASSEFQKRRNLTSTHAICFLLTHMLIISLHAERLEWSLLS